MSTYRRVETRFWGDSYIAELDPSEKLLFLYYLTNDRSELCGIYEIPVKMIAMETGIDKDMVSKITERFEKDGKIFYRGGWVYITNYLKYTADNHKTKEGIERSFKCVPQNVFAIFSELISKMEPQPIDPPLGLGAETPGVLPPSPSFSPFNSNGNTNNNLDSDLVPGFRVHETEEASASSEIEIPAEAFALVPKGRKTRTKVRKAGDPTLEQDLAIGKMIDLFKTLGGNEMISYSDPWIRKAALELVVKLGEERAIEITRYAISIQGDRFSPVISNPKDLRRKYDQLASNYKRNAPIGEKLAMGTATVDDIRQSAKDTLYLKNLAAMQEFNKKNNIYEDNTLPGQGTNLLDQ